MIRFHKYLFLYIFYFNLAGNINAFAEEYTFIEALSHLAIPSQQQNQFSAKDIRKQIRDAYISALETDLREIKMEISCAEDEYLEYVRTNHFSLINSDSHKASKRHHLIASELAQREIELLLVDSVSMSNSSAKDNRISIEQEIQILKEALEKSRLNYLLQIHLASNIEPIKIKIRLLKQEQKKLLSFLHEIRMGNILTSPAIRSKVFNNTKGHRLNKNKNTKAKTDGPGGRLGADRGQGGSGADLEIAINETNQAPHTPPNP